ncbi:MAG: patatin-like phospholipase family protein [Clostridia bacterium]|nr:patatin-like phospholipase family protein [Clostridia bacterium]
MGIKNFFDLRKIKKFRKKHKIGLCLSGGGARGFSYIGVFKALEENGIKFDMVAGTSVGSLFGALYASGMTVEEMAEKAKNIKNKDFRNSKLGFLPSKMDRLSETLDNVLPAKKIEDLQMPYYAVAVDLRTGKEIHFNEGNLTSIITGSCAIPGVFVPVKYKNMLLVDGGVSNNIPADVLKSNGCDYVVTIDCNCTRGGGTNSNSLITQFFTSVGIMMVNNSKKGHKCSDVLVCPDMKRFNSLKIIDKEEMIKEGYKATMEKMPEIKKLFAGKIDKK